MTPEGGGLCQILIKHCEFTSFIDNAINTNKSVWNEKSGKIIKFPPGFDANGA